MNSKLFGGILLVVGTSIGAGMLALPVATAELGFWGSIILLVLCWAIMTACAFLFLEVNLWLPPNTNLISMAGATLGWFGQAIAWIVYLLLLYSVLSAYIAGGGDLFHYLLQLNGWLIPLPVASILFTALFGLVVYFGIRAVDYFNRGLMFGKMGAYFLLVILIFPFISMTNLDNGSFKFITSPTSVTITVLSFGCLMIIPSLRTYFEDDLKALRKAIFIGSIIPLFCYIAWDMVIMGVIPLHGALGLRTILHSSSSNSALVSSLSSLLQQNTISLLSKFFTSICMATSFLSISLCLSDFLADGLRIKKEGFFGKSLVFSATFLPPIVIALFVPNAFIYGLNYAGLCCLILMVLMPPLMVWSGRYYHGLAQGERFQVMGGKYTLGLLLIIGAIVVVMGIKTII